MRTRILCAGLMMLGMSIMASSCSKEDNDERMGYNPEVNLPTNRNLSPATPVTSWKTVETKNFTMQVPVNWDVHKLGGMETYTGFFTDNDDTIHYDYGMRYQPFPIDQRFSYHYERIDGELAKIIDKVDGKQQAGIIIDTLATETVGGAISKVYGFTMLSSANAPADASMVLKMIRSLNFKNN